MSKYVRSFELMKNDPALRKIILKQWKLNAYSVMAIPNDKKLVFSRRE